MMSLLKNRVLLGILGLMLLAILIWFLGPYVGFVFGRSEVRPLQSIAARMGLIGVVSVAWLLSQLWARLRAAKASDNLMAAVVRQTPADKEQTSGEAAKLRERFEEAVAALKRNRRGGHTLYDVPWYVFIGPPGSGKTTALVYSGLKFPIEQRSGRGALKGVGGTRNCDWWFTDDAVFLDTAGRYLTQDSDEQADSAGWAEFLGLLKKYRTRRPLNGVILTISALDLMTQGHYERESYIAAARRRLEELNKELRIPLPVYVMVTKCDLVAGFNEYFDDLSQEGRAQVWGTTFPYDDTVKGTAASRFDDEFDQLMTRLNERMFAKLETERDERRRVKMFGFPQQMASIKDALVESIGDTFGSTRFEKQILLRGVYFTSGTQEGTPIDRLLGSIGRAFAVSPGVVAPQGRGKAFFVERLLRDVLFAESGLAGLNWRLEARKAAGQLGVYVAIAIIAVLGVVALTVSYRRNATYVEQVGAEADRLTALPPMPAGASLDSMLPRLDAIRAVTRVAGQYSDGAPFAMRWGLYQGSSLANAANDAYARELDGALLPEVASRIERRLVEYGAEPERLYEYLKAYLMLDQPARLDRQQLAYIADLEWKTGNPESAAALSAHFGELLRHEDALRRIPANQDLVAQARRTIRQASLGGLIYRNIRLSYASDTARALRLDVASGVGADRVLRRRSGVPLSQPILALYTAPVFREVAAKATDALAAQFAADRWVWGDDGAPRESPQELRTQFLDLYEKDYIAVWEEIIRDVQPVAMATAEQTRQVLATLAGPTSPLRGFLKTVDEHTYLVASKPEAAPSESGSVRKRLDDLFAGAGSAAPPALPQVVPGQRITEHFAPFHLLVAGDAGAAPIDAVIRKLEELQREMGAVGTNVGEANPASAPVVQKLGTMANDVKRDAAALPAPVGSFVNQVADRVLVTVRGGLQGYLRGRYEQEVLRECRDITSGRYPFLPSSTTDLPLADFGRLFGYNGVYDTFFASDLRDLVDTNRATWTWKRDDSGAQVAALPLQPFENARRIRDIFFRSGSQDAELRFRMTPSYLDAGSQRFVLEMDGQTLEDRHAAERTVQAAWPGPNPGSASVTFEERSGRRPNLATRGPWAWFRLIDASRVERETDERYVLTFTLEGHEAKVTIDALTIRNPYAKQLLQQFRCS